MPYEIPLPLSPKGGYYTYQNERRCLEWLIEQFGQPHGFMEIFELDDFNDWPRRKVLADTVEWNEVTHECFNIKRGYWLQVTHLDHECWGWHQKYRIERTTNTSTSTIDETMFVFPEEIYALQFKLVLASLCE